MTNVPAIRDYLQERPIIHVEKVQGVDTLQPYQKEILTAIQENERVVISACHDIGKTWTLAKAVLWLGSCFPGAKIITTAPTHVQVEQLLWAEIRAGFNNSRGQLGGKMLSTKWTQADDWFALGMSPKEDAGSGKSQGADSRFQGFHGSLVVVIFDEATGVSQKRWLQSDGMLTSGHVKFVAIGNPTTKNCEFARCFNSPMYRKIRLTCFDSPNLKANNINTRVDLFREVDTLSGMSDNETIDRMKSYKITHPKLLTLQWVVGYALKLGIDHPLFVSKALGEFPEEDELAIMPLSVVQAAQERKSDTSGTRSIGVDPARYGADKSVITVIEGKQQTYRKSLKHANTAEVTGHIVKLVNSLSRREKEIICVDATGLGAGVFDQLKERRSEGVISGKIILREIHFGASCPKDKDRENYVNLKAKIFIELGQDLKNELSIIPDSVYLEELPTILGNIDSKGRYVIESKDDYKKRTGMGSPDNADSLAIANYGRHDVHATGVFGANMISRGSNSPGSTSGTIVGSDFSESW